MIKILLYVKDIIFRSERGDDLKNYSTEKKKNFCFHFFRKLHPFFQANIKLKGQSDYPGLRPDTSSLVFLFWFSKNVTEYLCLAGFFSRPNSTFDGIFGYVESKFSRPIFSIFDRFRLLMELLVILDGIFSHHPKVTVVLSYIQKDTYIVIIFRKVTDCQFDQFEIINARCFSSYYRVNGAPILLANVLNWLEDRELVYLKLYCGRKISFCSSHCGAMV